MERRSHSEESDEGLGHSGSDGESNRTGSPTHTHPKIENLEELEKIEKMNVDPENVVLDENGKRKEDLYKCRYCDRTFCYLCHLKVIISTNQNVPHPLIFPISLKINSTPNVNLF